MALLVVGLNHKTAPVAVRERLAFADQTLAEPLAQWHDPAVEEVVILSTCNRVECYLQGPDAEAGARCCIDFLAASHGLPEAQFVPHLYQWLAAREAAPTIVALRQWAETTRREELDTALARMGPLEERQRRALETFSVSLVHKLCHMPTVNLKRAFREGRGPEYVQLVRHLFALDP